MIFSIEAEQAVCGGLLVDPEKLTDVLEVINYQDFYTARCRTVFHAIQSLAAASHPFDAITVSESLQAGNQLDDVGGMGYIIELASQVSSTSNLIAYARIIGEKSLQRKIIDNCQSVIDATGSGRYTTQELISHAQEQMAIIDGTTKADVFDTFQELLKCRFKALDDRSSGNALARGVTTGFAALDERFGLMEPGELILLAARPSMGKTTLALNIVTAAASQGDVLVFSLEMTKEQLVDKMICASAGINYKAFKDGQLDEQEWSMVEIGARKIRNLNITIIDRAAMEITHAVNIAKKIARSGNLKLIMADYLQLFRCKAGDRFNEVSEISRSLKAMAKHCNCPVLALSQLSRKCEERGNKRPIPSDLRESGQIEQDADIICFIYRDEVYNEDTRDKGIAEIITAKNREGEIGTDGLQAELNKSRFTNLSFKFKAHDDTENEKPSIRKVRGWNP